MQVNSKIYSNFCSNENLQTPNIIVAENIPRKKGLNIPVLISSTAGTMIPLYVIARKQGGSLLKLSPFRFMAIFKNGTKSNVKLDKITDILTIAAGSITGGLLGGIIRDKGKNTKEKVKEATSQMIANIGAPMIAVCGLIKFIDKKLPKTASKWVRILSKAGATVSGIIGGYLLGSTAVKFINNKIIDKNNKFERKIQVKDLIYQADELSAACAVSNTNASIPFIKLTASELLGKVIPFFFISAGYETGKK